MDQLPEQPEEDEVLKTEPIQTPPPTPTGQNVPKTYLKKAGGPPTFKILAALALIIAILTAGFFFFQRNQGSAPPPSSSNEETAATEAASAEEPKPEGEVAYVSSETGLNLREEASTISRILQTLPNGTEVTILSDEGDWYLVEVTTRGYVAKEYVTKTKPKSVLKVYSASKLNFKFIYPESYKITLAEGEPNTFDFESGESSGGFSVNQEATGTTIAGFLATEYPKATSTACDITIGNAKDCKKVKAEEEEFYLVNAAAAIYKFVMLAGHGNFPYDRTQTIFPSFYFVE